MAKQYIDQKIIPIAILATDYNIIKPGALETGLLELKNKIRG